MELFNDCKMVGGHPIGEQAYDIQSLLKELESFKCEVLDKFAAGSIIAKFSLSWRYFSVVDLVVSLNVEEKTRAKVIRSKGCFFFWDFQSQPTAEEQLKYLLQQQEEKEQAREYVKD